jgi:hypothetical protein
MSDSASRLPEHPSLEQLKKQAKELLRAHRLGEQAALQRFRAAIPGEQGSALQEQPALADAQFVIAREYGFESWARLKHSIEALPMLRLKEYEDLAKDLASAHMNDDVHAVRVVNRRYSTAFVADFHDPVMKQQRLPTWFASASRAPDLAVEDARQMVAHAYGFKNWTEFTESLAQPPAAAPQSAPFYRSSSPPFFQVDWEANRITSRGPQSERDWEAIVAVVKARRLSAVSAVGITDAAVKELAGLDHVTHLSLRSDALTDDGLRHLAEMPQLLDLELGGRQITDRGLAALGSLTGLRRFQSCWTQGISDAGAANLAACDRLESVDLLGTAAGDGLIEALAGKASLRMLKTGRGVTDRGIELLHNLPVFKNWQGGEIHYGLLSPESRPNHLLIDGGFTDRGLRSLEGLEGLFGVSFFWHCRAFTSAGLEPLRRLPHLGFLGCQGVNCDDEAMRQIAAIPGLRMLMGQGSVATDEGWEALSRSRTIEYIWGRECPNLTGRGFASLASMPSLRGLGVSLSKVDDPSLALLPSFPSLRELMPMEVPDAGFRHVGRCENLEDLIAMYCRATGDAATEHIAGLARLKKYYAGMTQITDRSLEILGRMDSLECIEFYGCQGITEKGVAYLAALPRLKELAINGSPAISREVLEWFPAQVHLKFPG